MGEIAEMMLDGTICEGCGEYLGECGFHQRCAACIPQLLPAPTPQHKLKPTGKPIKLTAAQNEVILKAHASNGGGLAHWRCAKRDLNRLLKLALLMPKRGVSRHICGGSETFLYVPTPTGKALAIKLMAGAES